MRTLFKRLATLLLALIFSVAFIIPIGVYAQEENQEQEKVIRVGWHEAPYFITDQHGRRSGYSYEYLRKIASYTGWKYEYVTGSWSDLLQMLKITGKRRPGHPTVFPDLFIIAIRDDKRKHQTATSMEILS